MRKRKGGGGLCFENWLGHALLPELVGVIYIYPFFEPSLPTPELSNFNKIADMASAVPATGRELSNPPLDGITNLRFSNHSDHLLVSSWDKVCIICSSFSVFIYLLSIPLIGVMMVLFRVSGCMMRVQMCWEESLCTLVPSSIVASTMIPPASVSPPTTLLEGHLPHSLSSSISNLPACLVLHPVT